jgi:hypothetical protein
MEKEYLGDSVYAEYDYGAIVLTTENGLTSDPSNTVVIENFVMDELNRFAFSKGYRSNLILRDNQIHCRHEIGVTTIEGIAAVIYEDEASLMEKYGGIANNYCPRCGLFLSKLREDTDDKS